MWGQTIQILSCSSPKRDCSPKRVKGRLRYSIKTNEKIIFYLRNRLVLYLLPMNTYFLFTEQAGTLLTSYEYIRKELRRTPDVVRIHQVQYIYRINRDARWVTAVVPTEVRSFFRARSFFLRVFSGDNICKKGVLTVERYIFIFFGRYGSLSLHLNQIFPKATSSTCPGIITRHVVVRLLTQPYRSGYKKTATTTTTTNNDNNKTTTTTTTTSAEARSHGRMHCASSRCSVRYASMNVCCEKRPYTIS